jgi:hypothetical protein
MHEKKITDYFSFLDNKEACIFRYDRWEKLLFLEVYMKPDKRAFLVCNECHFLEYESPINLNDVRIILSSDTLTLSEKSHNFMVECASIEVWDTDKFNTYDLDLDSNMNEEKRYGIRKPIFSLKDL